MEKLILNRLKIVLAEKNRSNRWVAQRLDLNENTVSRWVNNIQQPSLLMLYKISIELECDVRELLVPTIQVKTS
jgi:putative transcriptional regulator